MYYYYDVLLNFGDESELYEFYEWEEKDNVDFVKKIPLFRVATNTLKDQIKYHTKFDPNLLPQIENKTILKALDKNIKYAMLLCDTKNALALELDEEGNVISRSKLLLGDEINLNEMMFTMKETNLKYEKKEKYQIRRDLRQIEKIKNLIKCEIDTLYQANNSSKLKYLYYEWFNETSNDLEKMIEKMKTKLKGEYDESINRIYDVIKISYNKVN